MEMVSSVPWDILLGAFGVAVVGFVFRFVIVGKRPR